MGDDRGNLTPAAPSIWSGRLETRARFSHDSGKASGLQFLRASEVFHCNASGSIRPGGITNLFRDLQA